MDNVLPTTSIQNTCFSITPRTVGLLWIVDTGCLQMTNNTKLCKSCKKEANTSCKLWAKFDVFNRYRND